MEPRPTAGPDVFQRAMTVAPKPLVRQTLLLVPVSIDVGVMAVLGAGPHLGATYLVGLTLLLVATVVAALASSRIVSPRWGASLPYLDLPAIGLMTLVADPNCLALLAVLPAMWLGADRGGRGVAEAFGLTVLVFSVPNLLWFDPMPGMVSRAVLTPILVAMCAMTVAAIGEVWVKQNKQLEEQGRRLQEALRQVTADRALNDAITSTVDVGLLALDREGNYRAMNPQLEEFQALAYPDRTPSRPDLPGDVYGPDRVTPMPLEDYPAVRALRGEAFNDHLVWVGPSPEQQKVLSVSAGPIRSPEGDFDGAVLVYKDVTDLVSALKIKDEFLAAVSHELRTPLTSMIGYLELILDEDEDSGPVVRRQLEVVKRNSDRLLRLVDDLLFTAQADVGKMPLDLTLVDLAAVVEHAMADLAPRACEAGVTLRQHRSTPTEVIADGTRLRQVVDNLLSNAIKYTPTGGSVTVDIEHRDGEVRLSVHDTGLGISRDDLTRLFTRFFRTHDAQARAIQGVGLGLAITKAIVTAHDGSIEVDSEHGQGTTFTVVLPMTGPGSERETHVQQDESPSVIAG